MLPPRFPGILIAALLGCGSCTIDWGASREQEQALRGYLDAHFEDLGTQFVAPLHRDEFFDQLRHQRVLFVGDQHRDRRLHQQVLALLDDLCDRGFRPVIGMEAIGREDNPSLQEFVLGGIDMDTLRSRVRRRWPASWLENEDVDRVFFRQLIERVRQRRLDAFPLEPTPRLPLSERDVVIARSIRRAMKLYPDRLILVVVGHAHIRGRNHLHDRIASPSMTISARCSGALAKLLATQAPVAADAFLRTDEGVLFFPQIVTGQVIE